MFTALRHDDFIKNHIVTRFLSSHYPVLVPPALCLTVELQALVRILFCHVKTLCKSALFCSEKLPLHQFLTRLKLFSLDSFSEDLVPNATVHGWLCVHSIHRLQRSARHVSSRTPKPGLSPYTPQPLQTHANLPSSFDTPLTLPKSWILARF